jgi:hypothetical protein
MVRAPPRPISTRGGGGGRGGDVAQFTAHTQETRTRAILKEEAIKEAQLRYLERTEKDVKSILERTVFVDNVHDLRNPRSLKKLRTFFHRRFGVVQDCILARYVGRKDVARIMNPSARVRFQNEASAKKVVDLRKLDYPQADCADGSGKITVSKSQAYDMKLEAVEIELKADKISIGHYIPNEAFSPHIPWRVNRDNTAQEEWLEEEYVKETIRIKINMMKRIIELESPRYLRNGEFDFSDATDYAIIRFKSVLGPMDICRCNGSLKYSLILALKYPPKLQSDAPSVGLGFAIAEQDLERERTLAFGQLNAESLEHCFAIKLDLMDGQVEQLLCSRGVATLRTLGMIRSDFKSVHQARTIAGKQLRQADPMGPKFVHEQLEELHDWNASIGTFRQARMFVDMGVSRSPSLSFEICARPWKLHVVRRPS